MRLYQNVDDAILDRNRRGENFTIASVPKGWLVARSYPKKADALTAAADHADEFDQLRYVIDMGMFYIHISSSECFLYFGQAPHVIPGLVFTATPGAKPQSPLYTIPVNPRPRIKIFGNKKEAQDACQNSLTGTLPVEVPS